VFEEFSGLRYRILLGWGVAFTRPRSRLKMPFSSFRRGLGTAALLACGAASVLLPGCYSVEGDSDPECDRDSDCDDGEFCTDDDECESACRQFCATSSRCVGLNVTESQCRDSCEALTDQTAACSNAMVGLAACWEGFSSCNDALIECTGTFDVMQQACIPPCSYLEDGVCDEGTFCAAGTDTLDCASDNSCVFRYDGVCDEGTYCDPGTDSYDCGAG
jgi:hypothetical protein